MVDGACGTQRYIANLILCQALRSIAFRPVATAADRSSGATIADARSNAIPGGGNGWLCGLIAGLAQFQRWLNVTGNPWRGLSVTFATVSIGWPGTVWILKRCTIWARTSWISSMAMPAPMQVRGPAANGR